MVWCSVVEEVANKQIVLLVEGMVEAEQHIVVVCVADDVQVLEREPYPGLESVDVVNTIQNDRVVVRRLAAALAFIVTKQESPVFHDRAAQREAVLILLQPVQFFAGNRVGGGDDAAGVQLVIATILVNRTMEGVRPTLGDDVHDPAYSAPEFGRVAAVDDAEFSDGLLSRG